MPSATTRSATTRAAGDQGARAAGTDAGTHVEPAASGAAAFGAAVAGLGTALPDAPVPTKPIELRLGLEPDWIVSRTGIRSRRIAGPTERLSDLAALAGRRALDEAAIAPDDVDLVLVATFTADEILPACAPLVAQALGARRAGALDVGAACTGFVTGLALAAGLLESGRAACVLVIGADLLSRVTDRDDRSTAGLFGDGAGAAVLVRTEPPGALGPVVLAADATRPELLRATRERAVIEMDGPEVFRHAVARMAEATDAAVRAAGIGLGDVDLFVYHQANARITRSLGQRLALPPEKVVDCIEGLGNTSAASVPLALDAARSDGRLHDGARVLLCAFGAGFTWGAAVLEWRLP